MMCSARPKASAPGTLGSVSKTQGRAFQILRGHNC